MLRTLIDRPKYHTCVGKMYSMCCNNLERHGLSECRTGTNMCCLLVGAVPARAPMSSSASSVTKKRNKGRAVAIADSTSVKSDELEMLPA